MDCRRIISYPDIASFVTESACRLLAHKDFDAVAGGETAGIPFAAWVAAKMNKPMLYVRKKPKGFGLGARIEGVMPEGQGEEKPRVLLVEDHATDGKSKISFVEALRDAGAVCSDAFVVFYYDIFPEAALLCAVLSLSKTLEAQCNQAARACHGVMRWRAQIFSARIFSCVVSVGCKRADHGTALSLLTIRAVNMLDNGRKRRISTGKTVWSGGLSERVCLILKAARWRCG